MTDSAILPASPKARKAPAGPAPAGNTATGWLKLIALVFMLIDHMGAVIFKSVPEMRIIGRLAMPIYCWCMVVGFHYTRSAPKYLLRILLVGLASQPVYAFAMDHLPMGQAKFLEMFRQIPAHPENILPLLSDLFSKPNIFLTLFLGLAALWGIRERRLLSQFWAPVLCLILANALGADYSWRGVLLILLLYAARTSRPAIAAVMTAFSLYWGAGYTVTKSLFGLTVDLNHLPPFMNGLKTSAPSAHAILKALYEGLMTILKAFMRLETYSILSLPFLLVRFPKNLRLPVWLGYALYPAHLFLILLLKYLIR